MNLEKVFKNKVKVILVKIINRWKRMWKENIKSKKQTYEKSKKLNYRVDHKNIKNKILIQNFMYRWDGKIRFENVYWLIQYHINAYV